MEKLEGVCYRCGYPLTAESGGVLACPWCAAKNRAVSAEPGVKPASYIIPVAIAAALFLIGGRK